VTAARAASEDLRVAVVGREAADAAVRGKVLNLCAAL
jgi:hypothetical protein